jgi:hypothetical protein
MSSNDITGDRLISKPTSKQYQENYDRIFRKSVEPVYNAIKQELLQIQEKKNENPT